MVELQAAAVATIRDLARQLRVDSIRSTTEAGSGHPTSSMSAADLMAVLMTKYLKFDFDKPQHPGNDRLIFSKGHAAPLLYSMYRAAGCIGEKELLSLRKFGSRLEGHPVPRVLPWVDVATGSLGQGLAMGVGMAMDSKYLDKIDFRVWVLLGDSEMAEGSVWEAMAAASHYQLNNLIAILDMNRLGQRGETALGWDSATYAARARGFGFHVIEINGHDIDQIDFAYQEACGVLGQPTLIIAKTEKGHGLVLTANQDGWHGKPLSKEQARDAIETLGGVSDVKIDVQKPQEPVKKGVITAELTGTGKFTMPPYTGGVATREAYGDGLKALGNAYNDVVVLDAEVSNSTYAEKFSKAFLDRFFEMYIAEQLMVGVGLGLATRGKKVFCSTFAAFFARAYDFIRMAAVSRGTLKLCGSHAGCSIGADGPSQMALEDIAMMRAVHGSTVLYPCDAISCARLVEKMYDLEGISYLRTTREKTRLIYKLEDEFEIGGSKVLRSDKEDMVTLIGAGITLHECLKAYDELKDQGITVRVIDLYSVKPIDVKTLQTAARETEALIVVEDHWVEGGLGDAVLDAFAVKGPPPRGGKLPLVDVLPKVIKIAVRSMPGSGEPQELMEHAGISAGHIVATVKGLVK
ncbi:MAG: transketolase [Cyanobacteria bacterium SZAS LIN-3]|nr:transketolase [Cyanobacteria bacterium SZAS LIN-3]